MNLKYLSITFLTGVMILTISFIAYSAPEDEIKEKALENESNYTPGAPLTYDDFTIFTDNTASERYDYNLLTQLYAEVGRGEGGYYYWYTTPEDEINTDTDWEFYTYRGIEPDSTENDIIKKYGVGVTTRFDPSTDETFIAIKENGDRVADIINDNCYYCTFYNYNDLAQIAFYYNSDKQCVMIVYGEGICYYADSSTTKTVQKYLNGNGYNCGTVDGIAGSNTKKAISEFQEDRGLFVSGLIDDSLLKMIESDAQNKNASDSHSENVNERIDDKSLESSESDLAVEEPLTEA